MDSITIGYIIFIVVLAYLAGSIPFGLILARRYASVDVLRSGSGNIGATNVRRVAGTGLGILTLFLDGLKGALPVYAADMASATTGWNDLAVIAAALAAFGGHLYPVYMKCRNGGKGVATAFGCLLVISAKAAGACLLIYLAGILLFKRSSAGSLLSTGFLPVMIWLFRPSPVVILGGILIMVMVFIRHQDNIQRLIHGTEPPVW
ncbi:MAG: glycerol-3-phosphate 1-O-acyltransferase PlsY [Desulfatirhabdiaceae bacterium]